MKSLALRKLVHLGIALALACGAWGAMPATAQINAPAAGSPAGSVAPQARLADLLRPDGTLDLTSGLRGSVDARSYRLVSGSDGAPRFAPIPADEADAALVPDALGNPGDENWAAGFHGLGVNGEIGVLVADNGGSLYAGGDFTIAGGAVANHIAKWNGSSWSALGSGMNGDVGALAVDGGGNLYAGGSFTSAGGVAANRIAKWDGSSWSALGSGMEGYWDAVRALAVDGNGNLYAGGGFSSAGGVEAHSVAKWDGSGWNALGSGMQRPGEYSSVGALAMDGRGNLYAGGLFDIAGDEVSRNIARWTAADGRVISGPGSYTFYANNLPVTMVVPPGGQGDLARINIQRFDKGQARAIPSIRTGYYWQIEGLNASGGTASGYSVNLTFSAPGFTPDGNDEVCRYTGSRLTWDCAMTSYTADTITRNGVTHLSDWALGKVTVTIRESFLPLIWRRSR